MLEACGEERPCSGERPARRRGRRRDRAESAPLGRSERARARERDRGGRSETGEPRRERMRRRDREGHSAGRASDGARLRLVGATNRRSGGDAPVLKKPQSFKKARVNPPPSSATRATSGRHRQASPLTLLLENSWIGVAEDRAGKSSRGNRSGESVPCGSEDDRSLAADVFDPGRRRVGENEFLAIMLSEKPGHLGNPERRAVLAV